MAKRVLKTRLLSVIMAVVLVVGICVTGAAAASPAGAATAGSTLVPCTSPLFGPDKDCESTSPNVERFVQFYSGDQSCTYTVFVDWGDGSSSSRTFVGPVPAVYPLASHTYGAEARTTTYTETVTSSVDSAACQPIPTTVFHFTHLLPVQQPWWTEYGLTKACLDALLPNPVELGLGLAQLGVAAGLFVIPGGQLVDVVFLVNDVGFGTYRVFRLARDCVQKSNPVIPLVHAFAYGDSHLGKLFTPPVKIPPTPQITGIYGYQKGSLVYFSLSYADPGHDAKGFGFVGIKGARWALENHPFSHPSYGIVGNHRIDYPFNLACGTAQEYKSYVEAWIYDSHGQRSNPVEVDLSCTT